MSDTFQQTESRRIGVTGPEGFIGRQLVPHLLDVDHSVRALSRRAPAGEPQGPDSARLQAAYVDLERPDTIVHEAFEGLDAVIHLAGLAHNEAPGGNAAAERLDRINVDGARRVAEAAATAGVRRFVFVSSATVHGPTSGAKVFREDSPLAPVGAYAASKVAAETALRRLAQDLDLQVCIVRPPLVYGPGAKGNVARLMAWAERGRPLPECVRANQRDMVGLSNLCAFLELAATRTAAANETFLVSDGTPTSTGDFFEEICRALGRPARFLPVPRPMLRVALGAAGRRADLDRLMGDFRLNIEKARARLRWSAPVGVAAEIGRTAAAFRQ